MIKIEHSVVVDRPVEEVFAYATDVSKVPEWQTSALEARVDGPMRAGATGAIVRKFLGRRAITHDAAAGNPQAYIQMKAGHSSSGITERYVHAAAVLFPGAADKAEARLFGAVEVES